MLRETFMLAAAALALGPAVSAFQEKEAAAPASGKEKLEALLAEYQTATTEFFELYEAAPEADRGKLYEEKYPQPDDYAPRFLAIAREYPGSETACSALIWVATSARDTELVDSAVGPLLEEHIESPELAQVCRVFERRYADGAQSLQRLIEESPHVEVRGAACYSLGQHWMGAAGTARRLEGADEEARAPFVAFLGEDVVARLDKLDPDELELRAKKAFIRVVEEFGDVDMYGRRMAEVAEGDLFELENLGIGKVAPEIEGEDIDGVPFKLSDYRGKVVVLDFWGHW